MTDSPQLSLVVYCRYEKGQVFPLSGSLRLQRRHSPFPFWITDFVIEGGWKLEAADHHGDIFCKGRSCWHMMISIQKYTSWSNICWQFITINRFHGLVISCMRMSLQFTYLSAGKHFLLAAAPFFRHPTSTFCLCFFLSGEFSLQTNHTCTLLIMNNAKAYFVKKQTLP